MSKELRNTLIVAAVFLIMALGVGWDFWGNKSAYDEVNTANEEVAAQIKKLAEEADPKILDALKNELKDLNDNFKDYVKILPSEEVATEEDLLRSMRNYVTTSGIQLNSYSRGAKPASKGEFDELTLVLRAEGTFEQFVSFLNLLERDESFLRVNQFSSTVNPEKIKLAGTPGSLLQGGKDEIPLTLSVEVSTYRYLTPKKKAAAPAGEKPEEKK